MELQGEEHTRREIIIVITIIAFFLRIRVR